MSMDRYDVSPSINIHFNWLNDAESEAQKEDRSRLMADVEPQLRHVALMAIQAKVEELQAEEVKVEETAKTDVEVPTAIDEETGKTDRMIPASEEGIIDKVKKAVRKRTSKKKAQK